MEQKNIWKNVLLLAIGSLIVFHVDMSGAGEDSEPQTEAGCMFCGR